MGKEILIGDVVSTVEKAVKAGTSEAFAKVENITKEVAALREEQRLVAARLQADAAAFNGAKANNLSISKYLYASARARAGVENPWAGAEDEQKAMKAQADYRAKALSVGSDTAGGFLAPIQQMPIVDLLRSKEIVSKLGCTTINATTGRIDIPTVVTDPTAAETAENSAITASDPTYGMYGMTPKNVKALTKLSKTLLRCGSGADMFVQRQLAAVYLRKKQARFFSGTGASGQPRGLDSWSTNSVAFSGAPTVTLLLNMMKELEADNADTDASTMAWALHPRAKYAVAQIVWGSSALGYSILTGPDATRGLAPTLFGIPYYTTTDITVTGGTSTTIYLVVGSEIVIAEWGPPEIGLSDQAGTSWESDQVWAKIAGEYDICVPHSDAIVRGTSVTVS